MPIPVIVPAPVGVAHAPVTVVLTVADFTNASIAVAILSAKSLRAASGFSVLPDCALNAASIADFNVALFNAILITLKEYLISV